MAKLLKDETAQALLRKLAEAGLGNRDSHQLAPRDGGGRAPVISKDLFNRYTTTTTSLKIRGTSTDGVLNNLNEAVQVDHIFSTHIEVLAFDTVLDIVTLAGGAAQVFIYIDIDL